MNGVPEWARRRQVIGVAIAVIAIGGSVGYSRWQDRDTTSGRDARLDAIASSRTVAYYIDGTASTVDVTWATPTGTSQTSAVLPLQNDGGTEGIHLKFGLGDFAYVSAQNRGDRGTVQCRIEVDGVTVSENVSSAAFGIAQCEARV